MLPISGLRLGKAAAKVDMRQLLFVSYASDLPTPPAACDYTSKVSSWGMLGNDRLGDCGFASAAHQIQTWTSAQDHEVTPTAQQVSQEYLSYNQGADRGVVLLDMLSFWRNTGIIGHRIGAYAALAAGNHDELKNSVYLFGGASLGVQLPNAWNPAYGWKPSDGWKAPVGPANGNWAPGTWGGHAVPVVKYGVDGVTVISWGMPVLMSFHAFDTYCDEAFVTISKDFFDPSSHKTVAGFDWDLLTKDLSEVGQIQGPGASPWPGAVPTPPAPGPAPGPVVPPVVPPSPGPGKAPWWFNLMSLMSKAAHVPPDPNDSGSVRW